MWCGTVGLKKRTNRSARPNLEKVRKLLNEKKVKEAEILISQTFISMPPSMRHYEPLGDIFLQFGRVGDDEGLDEALKVTGIPNISRKNITKGKLSNYKRKLQLSTGLATVAYTFNGVNYVREYFADVVNEVICVKVTSDTSGSVNFNVKLHRGEALTILKGELTGCLTAFKLYQMG